MARVSRTVSAKSRTTQPSEQGQSEVYLSINTLRSEQEQEDRQSASCTEQCVKGFKTFFNLTIASCECFTCWFSRKSRRSDISQLEDSGSGEDFETRCMKEELTFHFMNPFQKWRYSKKRRFPWKLLVQLISIVLVTTQLILFASTKFALTNYILENQSTFTQLFIRSPQDSDSDDPLPNPLSVLYTHDELQNQFNFTIERFFSIDTALGNYGYGWYESDNPYITLVTTKYTNSTINPASKIFQVSAKTYEECIDLYRDKQSLNWTMIKEELGKTLSFTFHFNMTSVFFQDADDAAECIQFHLDLIIKNDILAGNMPVTLGVGTDILQCNNYSHFFQSTILSSTGTTVIDVVVMFFAIISILQCLRSLISSWRLSREVKVFFWKKFDYRLKFNQIVPLFNMWFIGVIISNLLVLVGCIFKLLIAYNAIRNIEVVDIASIVVGLAVFGQWSGLLRFLSYFDKYNILLITLRLSLPSVIRFIVCTGILYIAFLLCGWLVLGPYHPKFKDPFVTSECLFSLINGDDMFATYKGMSTAPTAAYVFSKVYLYVFIALFIYVVLSVFISLISDTYETLHEHWYERSKGLLVDFASGKLGQPHYHTADCHTDTKILHDDHTQEEDYEYLREASQRFGPSAGDERPLICNGGPELRPSSASSVGSRRLRAVSMGSQEVPRSPMLRHVQGKGNIQGSWSASQH